MYLSPNLSKYMYPDANSTRVPQDCPFVVQEDMYEIFDTMPPKEQRTTGFFSATFGEDVQVVAADFMQADDSRTRYGYVFARIAPVLIVPRGIKQVLKCGC